MTNITAKPIPKAVSVFCLLPRKDIYPKLAEHKVINKYRINDKYYIEIHLSAPFSAFCFFLSSAFLTS